MRKQELMDVYSPFSANRNFSETNYQAICLLENIGCFSPPEELISYVENLIRDVREERNGKREGE